MQSTRCEELLRCNNAIARSLLTIKYLLLHTLLQEKRCLVQFSVEELFSGRSTYQRHNSESISVVEIKSLIILNIPIVLTYIAVSLKDKSAVV